MVGIRFCRCGCRLAPIRGILCRLWHETHTKDLRARFPARPEKRRRKARSQSSQQKRGVSDSQGKATVREKQLLKEELRLVEPEAGSASAIGWVSVPGSCGGISLWYTFPITTDAQISQKSVKNLSLHTLTQVRTCLFFFLILSATYIMSLAYL